MAILFDLDGTLLDTSKDFHVAINNVLAAQKRPPVDYQKIRNAISYGSKQIIADALGLDHITNAVHAIYVNKLLPPFLEQYTQTEFKYTETFPGIDALLTAIEKANLPWGIVTNKHKVLTEPLLRAKGYLDRSACLVCGDATPKPKPAPDHLLIACKMLKTTPDKCIFIGDSINDILAGKAAGMRTIAAAFGFIPQNLNVADWQADAIANHADEIFPWIQKWLKIAN